MWEEQQRCMKKDTPYGQLSFKDNSVLLFGSSCININ